MPKSLDQKLAAIHADPHGSREFIIADAKDAGVELPNLASLLGDDRSLDHVLGNAVSVGDAAATAAAPAVVSDAATAGLAQLSHLYEEQQYALMAA